MKRFILGALLMTIPAFSVMAQQGQKPAETKGAVAPADTKDAATDEALLSDQVYREITIESFENSVYNDQNASIQAVKGEKVSLQIRDEYPAPIKDSKKYLGVKVHGKSGNVARIIPPKELTIADHCQSISIWVYGKNFSGELKITLRDNDGQNKRFSFGKLNFLGWRKLSVIIPKDFAQEDKYLSKPKSIVIVNFLYESGRITPLKQDDWEYFYMDDVTAKVRKKYIDKQSDSW